MTTNGRRQWRRPKPTTNRPKTTTLGGKFNPKNPYFRQKSQPKTPKPRVVRITTPPRNRFRNPFMSNMVIPILTQQKGAPLEDPAWVHCIRSVRVSDTWTEIFSDGYPDQTSMQQQCTWMFYCDQGSKIRLSFNDVDLQGMNVGGGCKSQFVEVIEMYYSASQGKYCGERVPGDYVSKGTKLRLDIQRDTTVYPYRGFSAAVRTEPATTKSGTYKYSTLRRMATIANTVTVSTRSSTTATKRSLRRPTTTKIPLKQKSTQKNSVEKVLKKDNENFEFYGPNNQPQLYIPNSKSRKMLSSTTITLLAVGVIIFLFAIGGLSYYFKSLLWDMYQKLFFPEQHRKKQRRKNRKMRNIERRKKLNSMTDGDDISMTSSMYSRRKSVTFQDEWTDDGYVEQDGQLSEFGGSRVSLRDYDNEEISEKVAQEIEEFSEHPKKEFKEEPIYELSNDDEMSSTSKEWETSSFTSTTSGISTHSKDSVRTTSRHPDHRSFRKIKLKEKLEKTSTNNDMQHTEIPSVSSNVDKVTPPESSTPSFNTNSLYTKTAPYTLEQQQLDAAELLKKLLQQNPNLIKQETEKLEKKKPQNEVVSEFSESEYNKKIKSENEKATDS